MPVSDDVKTARVKSPWPQSQATVVAASRTYDLGDSTRFETGLKVCTGLRSVLDREMRKALREQMHEIRKCCRKTLSFPTGDSGLGRHTDWTAWRVGKAFWKVYMTGVVCV